MVDLSIIIPVYNVEKYIRRCVDSILIQRFSSYEVLLIDDGSTDNSGKICDDIANKNDKISVFHQKNAGCSVARNFGIQKAKGKYICFMDSDDEWKTDFLESIVPFIQKQVDMIIFGADVVDREKKFLSADKPLESKEYSGKEGVMEFLKSVKPKEKGWALNYIWNRLYKAEIIKDNDIAFYEKLNLGEDFVFNCEVMKYTKSIQILSESYYTYYKYFTNQLTMKFRTNELERRKFIFKKHIELYQYYDIFEEYKRYILIEEGMLIHTSIMMTAYNSCNLNFVKTKKYISSFMQPEQYEALIEYLNWDEGMVNKWLGFFYRHKMIGVISGYTCVVRKVRRLRMKLK